MNPHQKTDTNKKVEPLQALKITTNLSSLLGPEEESLKLLLKGAGYSRSPKLLKRSEDLVALCRMKDMIDDLPFKPTHSTIDIKNKEIMQQAARSHPKAKPEKKRPEIFIGNIILDQHYAGNLTLPLKSFNLHSAVLGQIGSGKSYLIKHIVPQLKELRLTVIILDCEGEYGTLLKSCPPEDIWLFNPATDRDNFLEPPPGVAPKEWLNKLKNIIREVFFLRDGSLNLLGEVLTKLYRERGIFEDSDDFPTIIDLVRCLDSLSFRPGSRFSGYHESLVNRFKSLLDNLEPVLCCKKGYHIAKEKEGKIIIYNTASLSDDVRSFYVNLKLLREATYREKLPPQGLKVVFVIEEAHTLFNASDDRYDLGESYVCRSARTLRKRGISIIFSDQVPSALPAPLMANVSNNYILRLSNGKCIRSVAQSTNLLREQAEYLPVIPKRQMIFMSADFPEPLLIEIPELSFEYVSPQEVENHMKSILENLPYTSLSQDETATSHLTSMNTVSSSAKKKEQEKPGILWKKVLEIVAEKRAGQLVDVFKTFADVSSWDRRKIKAEMEKLEMIEICSVCTGSRGNRKKYLTITPKGAAFIGVDYEQIKLAGKGSLEHRVLQYLISESMKQEGKTVAIEHHVNGKSVDIAEIRQDGNSIAYEIELQPSHVHVSENVKRDLEAGFYKVIIIVQNKSSKNQAHQQIFQTVDLQKQSKVDFMLVKEFFAKPKKKGK